MKKLFTLFLISVVLFLPFEKAQAAENNLLAGVKLYYGSPEAPGASLSNSFPIKLGAYSNKTVYFELDSPNHISKLILKVSGSSANVNIDFYNSEKVIIHTVNFRIKDVLSTITTNLEDVKYIKISNLAGGQSSAIESFEAFGNVPILHEDVNELSVISNTSNSVDLKWKTPGFNSEFTGTKVYRNDVLIATLDKTKGEYIDRNVQAETSYKYKVSATYTDQYETGGVSKSVTTQSAPPPMILESLQGKATHKDVEFTWKLPKREDFKRVNIFQDGVKVGTSTGQGFSLEGLEPSKLYKFSFTITDTNNIETTEPQFLSIKTLEEPPGVIEGGDFTEEVDGDLIITWEEPTKGKIKVFVGGKEYAIVPASDRRFTIPSKDIKYNIFGDPDVYLQPISDSGTPGEVTTPPKEEPPFSAGDLIESGNGLLWYISPLILLGLSFLLFPKLRDLLINAIRNKKNESNEKPKEIERFRTDETQMKDPQDQEMKKRMEKERLERKERQEIKEKHQGKAYLEKLEKRAKERKTLDFKISDSVEPRRRAERRSREPRTPRESKRTTREPREPRRRRGG